MVNPDGHEFCRTQNRLWRKNRRRNADGSFGVDPNRNYGYMWGLLDIPTSSHVPSDETYIGPRAFSEPETRAVRDLVARENFAGLITYHSFSQLVLYPWGYTSDNIADPVDFHTMNAMAQQMCNSILGVHGKVYTPQKSSQLYPTAGDTTDWTYGTYGIPSFTIELRPKTVQEGGFILPANQIGPTFEENRAAAFNLLEDLMSAPSATRSAAERAVHSRAGSAECRLVRDWRLARSGDAAGNGDHHRWCGDPGAAGRRRTHDYRDRPRRKGREALRPRPLGERRGLVGVAPPSLP
jgi:carboxypeptidase T